MDKTTFGRRFQAKFTKIINREAHFVKKILKNMLRKKTVVFLSFLAAHNIQNYYKLQLR